MIGFYLIVVFTTGIVWILFNPGEEVSTLGLTID